MYILLEQQSFYILREHQSVKILIEQHIIFLGENRFCVFFWNL